MLDLRRPRAPITNQLLLDGPSQSKGLARILLATLAPVARPLVSGQVHDPDLRFLLRGHRRVAEGLQVEPQDEVLLPTG